MLLRKALSFARIATTTAALAVAAFLLPGGTASAAAGTPVHVLTAHDIQQARTGMHPDNWTDPGCTFGVPGTIAVTPGSILDQGVVLCAGDYQLAMQTDGNLVFYGPTGAIWYTGSNNPQVTYAAIQTDGNFVVYAGNPGVPLWNSGTGQHPGAYLCIQNNGYLVVYAPNGTGQYTCTGSILWHS